MAAMFQKLISLIQEEAEKRPFAEIVPLVQNMVSAMNRESLLDVLREVGTLPERFRHDSTEEKLFAKLGDMVLARALTELGISASAIPERGNAADVVGESRQFGYTLVADAKSFRLSRTARNQKDFKITALSQWRGDKDFALLVAPYFQYPSKESQIYEQARKFNVCLFSWEQIYLLVKENCMESPQRNLSILWNLSQTLASQKMTQKEMQFRSPFVEAERNIFCPAVQVDVEKWDAVKKLFCRGLFQCGKEGMAFWEQEISRIQGYSHKQAVAELLNALKLKAKIQAIQNFLQKVVKELEDE